MLARLSCVAPVGTLSPLQTKSASLCGWCAGDSHALPVLLSVKSIYFTGQFVISIEMRYVSVNASTVELWELIIYTVYT